MTTAQTIADSKRVRVSSYEISSGAIGVTIVAVAVAAAGMAGGANPTMNGAGTWGARSVEIHHSEVIEQATFAKQLGWFWKLKSLKHSKKGCDVCKSTWCR